MSDRAGRGAGDEWGARFALDAAWRFSELTPGAAALLRREWGRVRGAVFWEVFPETVGSVFERRFRAAMAEGAPVEFEAPSPALTGWLAFRATPAAGGLVVTCRDLTSARRQAEAALRASEGRLELALRATPVTLFQQDRDLRYTWVRNPQLGLTAATLLGKTDDDILAPDDAAHFTALKRRVMATGEQIRAESAVAAGGETYHFDTTYEPVRDHDGATVGVFGIAVDVTARRRGERESQFLNEASTALAGSLDPATTLEQVARLTVPLLADYCVIDLFDAEGQLRRVTTAHADPAKDAAARALRHYTTRLENPHSKVARALRTGRPVFETAIDDRWVQGIAQSEAHLAILRALNPGSLLAAPLSVQGRMLGALIFFRARDGQPYGEADLPLAAELARRAAVALDNARLYHEAREAVGARDRFLSIASHELRTPVAGAKGYAQLLLRQQARGNLDAGRLTRGLLAIDEAADRLDRLTRDLLDVSRLRLDQFPLRREPLDLVAFTRAVVAPFHDRLDAGHSLVVELPDAPCPIDGDADRLAQVVSNLLDNAIKYSPSGGEIRLTLAPEAGGILLRVRDHGIGLPGGNTETIFEPFGRAPNGAARQIPGLGLGLHICREIIGRHGGWIRATSDGEDRGTTIAFWLPMASAPRATEGRDG